MVRCTWVAHTTSTASQERDCHAVTQPGDGDGRPLPRGNLGRRAAYDLCGSLHQLKQLDIVKLFYTSTQHLASWTCADSRGKYKRM
jgi:hypothetical protein